MVTSRLSGFVYDYFINNERTRSILLFSVGPGSSELHGDEGRKRRNIIPTEKLKFHQKNHHQLYDDSEHLILWNSRVSEAQVKEKSSRKQAGVLCSG